MALRCFRKKQRKGFIIKPVNATQVGPLIATAVHTVSYVQASINCMLTKGNISDISWIYSKTS